MSGEAKRGVRKDVALALVCRSGLNRSFLFHIQTHKSVLVPGLLTFAPAVRLSAVGKTAGKKADRYVQVESRSINEMAIVQRPELEQERDDYERSGRKGKFHSMIFRSKYSVEKQCLPDSGVDKWNGITGSHTVNGLGGETRGLWSDLGMKA